MDVATMYINYCVCMFVLVPDIAIQQFFLYKINIILLLLYFTVLKSISIMLYMCIK